MQGKQLEGFLVTRMDPGVPGSIYLPLVHRLPLVSHVSQLFDRLPTTGANDTNEPSRITVSVRWQHMVACRGNKVNIED